MQLFIALGQTLIGIPNELVVLDQVLIRAPLLGNLLTLVLVATRAELALLRLADAIQERAWTILLALLVELVHADYL